MLVLMLGPTLSAAPVVAAIFPGYEIEADRRVTASPEQLQRRLRNRGDALWKVPLGAALVEDLRWVDDDRIYAGLRADSAELETLDHLLLDAATGQVFWRQHRDPEHRYTTLYADANRLLFVVVDGGGKSRLQGIATASGEEQWSIQLGSRRVEPVAPALLVESGLVVIVDARARRWSAIDLDTGQVRWSRVVRNDGASPEPPVTDGVRIWDTNGSVARIDPANGEALWMNPVPVELKSEPPPQVDGSRLFGVADGQLTIIDADAGGIVGRSALPSGFSATNIIPTDSELFIRGRSSSGTAETLHQLLALNAASGAVLWTHRDAQPSLSNLVLRDDAVFHATAEAVEKLDRHTGELVFSSRITDTGRTYPVRLRDYPDRVVYIGELVIAGVAVADGSLLYRRGLTPISPETSLNSLDVSIPRLQQALGVDDGGGVLNLGETQRYQNMASTYTHQAQSYRTQAHMARSAGLSGQADRARLRSLEAQGAANRASQQARTAATVEMSLSIMNLTMQLQDQWRKAGIKARVDRQQLFRSSILAGYAQAETATYVYRPESRYRAADDHFVGVQITDLESGRSAFTYLSAAYESYGLWNLVDFERETVIHHGVGLRFEEFRFSEPRRPAALAPRIRTVENFLLASPVRIPRSTTSEDQDAR